MCVRLYGGEGGGTLFSVKEAASFWNTELVWRVVRGALDGMGLDWIVV